KVYQKGTPVILSDILPVLENMGMQVLSELPFEVRPLNAEQPFWIHDFMMATTVAYTPAQVEGAKAKFEEALSRIWYSQMENDSLNHLVLGAQMDWREIMILRGYVRYLKQTRSPFSTPYVERTLHKNAGIARSMVDLFRALFDPAAQRHAEKNAAKCMAAINGALEKVASLEEDRILRGITALINATLRTNFFQPDKDGNLKPYVAFKFDSKKLEDLPDPKPYREIWVYSTRVEGIHLRGDVIARGGIRWSDRFEDFRTEVLGLMKAQQVKNSIIVPMGAKGGFIVKKPPLVGGKSAYLQEGIECYKLFIRNLLEITDNRKGRDVIPPPNVVRRDGDDPYLVVAADKGTATFSDIANSLSIEFGFWLGDAFASGGSAGYDHKKIGITARGAWESVKRHFREMNIDTQKQTFDVMGVGDMAGDVYGNGMLQSDKMRVVGTFNHIHIFCDPDPVDTVRTFKERKRLFNAVKGWEEYDTKLLSKGGRIYNRSDKSLKLTPEIMKRFEITKENVTPAELIQALLKAQVDLLFFGGIGTYVKASQESHADVGDKGNDALRVNAAEIRAKVIGEGANLAVTQAARIEYAKKGGRLNADFIDNSGGVNCSDVEVNTKILLNDVMSEPGHKLNILKRNELLVRMTDEVAQLVLRNNYQQVQGISLMEYQAPANLPMHARLIDDLERSHGLSRKGAGLPDADEIEARIKQGKGLTRPELGILQAHAKILFTREVLHSDIPDMPEMEGRWLFDYFATPLRMKYEKEIRRHRLRREIIATTLVTSLVNRMGPVFIKSMADKTGASAAEVAKAFEVVREAFELDLLWSQLEALDNKVSADIQLRAMRVITQMAERETLWFLTRLGRRLDISRDIKAFQKGISDLTDVLDDVVTDDRASTIKKRMDLALSEGLPPELARHVAIVAPLGAACDITRISMEQKTDQRLIARIYFELGEYFHLHWLRQQARAMPAKDRWTAEAVDGLIELFYNAQAGLTARILQDMKKELRGAKAPKGIVQRWVDTYGHHAAQLLPFFADVRREGKVDVPMLMLTESRLRQLHAA
ncbi:MAG TPA: NAD-glutamate dehydrogenase domain-containing protein, partial [Patescibacteria group bacterium]|nr:NAD-glutamate dehydrogenase domain-containing protein [Patescibacteria group bacterium]